MSIKKISVKAKERCLIILQKMSLRKWLDKSTVLVKIWLKEMRNKNMSVFSYMFHIYKTILITDSILIILLLRLFII